MREDIQDRPGRACWHPRRERGLVQSGQEVLQPVAGVSVSAGQVSHAPSIPRCADGPARRACQPAPAGELEGPVQQLAERGVPHDGLPWIGPVEGARLEKEAKRLEGEIEKVDKKLGNTQFLERAPEEVVTELRERRAGYAAALEKVRSALEMLGG